MPKKTTPTKGLGSFNYRPQSHSHSVRVADERWHRAKQRAQREGRSMNYVMNQLLEGYAQEIVHMPEVTTIYSKPAFLDD